MARLRRPTYTKPLPANAELFEQAKTKNGKRTVVLMARWESRGRERTAPVTHTENGPRLVFRSRKYTIEYTDAKGVRRKRQAYADRQASEQLAAELERKVARGAEGLADPHEEHARRPLTEHLEDFGRWLRAKGDCDAHVRQTLASARRAFEGAGAVFPRDLDLGKVASWLDDLRGLSREVQVPEGKGKFTLAEVAGLLGVEKDSVAPLLRRCGLTGVGNGKARRFPRETVEALLSARAKGASPETVNHHVRAVRSFCRWMVRPANRMAANPLEGLKLLNTATDRRHDRRELTPAEVQRLRAAAAGSGREYRGIPGADRAMLYATAVGTGFRAAALASLTPESFRLDDEHPIAVLAARFNKSKRPRVQPIAAELAGELRVWLAGKAPGSPLWPGGWAKERKGAEMIRLDLAEAGIPYAIEGPDGPLFADFHALRHSYITALGRAGVDLRAAQELAGHSSPLITARYSHVRLQDLAGAVGRLPSFQPPDTGGAGGCGGGPGSLGPAEAPRHDDLKTGPFGPHSDCASPQAPKACPKLAHQPCIPSHPRASRRSRERREGRAGAGRNPLQDEAPCILSHSGAPGCSESDKADRKSPDATVDLDVAGSNPVTHPGLRQLDAEACALVRRQRSWPRGRSLARVAPTHPRVDPRAGRCGPQSGRGRLIARRPLRGSGSTGNSP